MFATIIYTRSYTDKSTDTDVLWFNEISFPSKADHPRWVYLVSLVWSWTWLLDLELDLDFVLLTWSSI